MAKPAFDPNKPFEKMDVQAQKPAFNPNKPFQAVPEDEPGKEGIGSALLNMLGTTAKYVDSYTGAPMRAAIAEEQKNGLAGKPISAFMGQFGEDPEKAPTGEQIVETAGVPHGSASKVLGFGMDMAANPLNFTGPIAAGVKGLGATAKMIPYVEGAMDAASAAPGKLATALASKFTNTPKRAIEIYAENPSAVNDLVSGTGGELSVAADAMKSKVLDNIKTMKQGLADEINQAISRPGNASVRYTPVTSKVVKAGKLESEFTPVQQATELANGQVQTIAHQPDTPVTRALTHRFDANGKPLAKEVQVAVGDTPAAQAIPVKTFEVNKSIQRAGKDVKYQPTAMEIQAKPGGVRPNISSETKAVEAKPIIEKLESARDALNPHYNSGDIHQINEMLDKVRANMADGKIDLQSLFETRNFLQSRAQSSFVKDGQLFVNSDKAARAANAARQEAATLLHKASPEIAHSDSVYTALHDLDDKMSSALLASGKSENVFASAGGAIPGKYANQHYTALKEIGQITGSNPIADAEKLYAAKQLFKEPTLRKEALKTLLTGVEAAKKTPAWVGKTALTLDEILASPSADVMGTPIFAGKPAGTAIDRRMSSQKK